MVLLDNGCQVNTVSPEFVEAHTLKVGLMSDLVKGRMCTHPLDYVIIGVQVDGVGGYKKDQITLVIPDLSKFTSRVPVTLGTLTIRRVINVIKESELNVLATPWVNAKVTYIPADHRANMPLVDRKVATWPINLTNLNEIVITKKSEKIQRFSSKVIHAQTMTMFMGCNLHVMMHALCEGNKPLPHGLAVQNTYTEVMTGSKSVAAVVANLTAPPLH